jgi:hypothetical protein
MIGPIKTRCVSHCERRNNRTVDSAVPALNDYDWWQAFTPAADMGIDVDAVAEILAMEDGVHDEADWIGLFKLKDGGVLFVESGCDYTGWDCRSNGWAALYASRTNAILDLTDQQRNRLGLSSEYAELMGDKVSRSR